MGRQAGRGSVMLWAMLNLCSAIQVDVSLTCNNYLSVAADHVHPFIETVLPDGCGLFRQDDVPDHKTEMVRESF